jgi:hypothetical protein
MPESPFLRLLQQVAVFKCEVVLVPTGLQREEGSIKAHGHDCDEGALPNRQRRPRRRLRKVGQQQAERDQRQDHAEIRVRALQIVVLLAVPEAAHQQRQPDHAVKDDHHDREQRVAHQRRVVLAVQHDRRDARDLDDRDRERQDQRAVRLAEPHRERSAWRTTDSAEPRMVTNSQANIPTKYAGCDKRAAKASPYHTKAAHVSSTA